MIIIEPRALALRIARFARSKKAQKVMVLDVRGISTFCDFFVILSGTSLRQVNALAHGIGEDASKLKITSLTRIPAEDESGWLALDYVSVVVHIFHKPMREFYSLERLWSDAKRVRIPRTLLKSEA